MTIQDTLKREFVIIEQLGKIEIKELSAKAQIEMSECYKAEKQVEAAFVACRHGVVGWEEATFDEMAKAMTLAKVQEIAGHILRLSGYSEDIEKNSVSAPNVVSS